MRNQAVRILQFGLITWIAMTPALASGSLGAYVGVGTGIVVNTENGGNGFRGSPAILFAGVGGQMDSNWYLAGEIFGNVATATWDDTHLKTTTSWGVSVLPGLALGDHLLGFLRLGALRNHFSWNNKTGAEVGLGVQAGLTHEWDVRGEYDYIQYNGNLKTDQFAVGLVYKII